MELRPPAAIPKVLWLKLVMFYAGNKSYVITIAPAEYGANP